MDYTPISDLGELWFPSAEDPDGFVALHASFPECTQLAHKVSYLIQENEKPSQGNEEEPEDEPGNTNF